MLSESFAGYELHHGGVGAGTVIGYRLRVGRHERAFVLGVEEPTPGRQLRERDRHGGLLVTWTLTPGGDGERTVVRVAAELRDPDLERALARGRARRRCAARTCTCSSAWTESSPATRSERLGLAPVAVARGHAVGALGRGRHQPGARERAHRG